MTLREETDWRRLSLHEAEGPFDFFTVDVSFVAARNMLRGLAFRLRAGAQGVVLVKPQFELPDHQVKGGEVRDRNLRRRRPWTRSVGAPRRWGSSCWPRLIPPWPAARGRWRSWRTFVSRGARTGCPRRESSARREAAPRARAAPDQLRWFAVVAPGLEPVTEREVRALDQVQDLKVEPGGIEWTGPLLTGLDANLWLRTATRVLARVGTVEAREFGRLRRSAAGLPWDRFIGRGAAVAIRASTSRCRLYHTGAMAETAALAIADAVKGVRLAPRTRTARRTCWCAVSRIASLSASTPRASGCIGAGRAPRSARRPCERRWPPASWRWPAGSPRVRFVDPICGAGTIAIEAALQALDRAPGMRAFGEFAIEDWPLFSAPDDSGGCRARAGPHARASGGARGDRRLGSGRARHRERAAQRRRGRRRRGADRVHVPRPGRRAPAGATPASVIANPPYGRRLADPRWRRAHLPRSGPHPARALSRLARRRSSCPLAAERRRRCARARSARTAPPAQRRPAHRAARRPHHLRKRDRAADWPAAERLGRSGRRSGHSRLLGQGPCRVPARQVRGCASRSVTVAGFEQRPGSPRVRPLAAPTHPEPRIVELPAARLAHAVQDPLGRQRQRRPQPLLEHLPSPAQAAAGTRAPPSAPLRRAPLPGSWGCPGRSGPGMIGATFTPTEIPARASVSIDAQPPRRRSERRARWRAPCRRPRTAR